MYIDAALRTIRRNAMQTCNFASNSHEIRRFYERLRISGRGAGADWSRSFSDAHFDVCRRI
jgi:hypothetical protein